MTTLTNIIPKAKLYQYNICLIITIIIMLLIMMVIIIVYEISE